MSVDVRTRVDGEQAPVDPARFFDDDLPAALGAAAPLLAEATAVLRLPPLVIDVDGDSWTLLVDDGVAHVVSGASGRDDAMRLRLDPSQLSDLVADQVTPMGWFTSGSLRLKGRLETLLDWWLLVQQARARRGSDPVPARGRVPRPVSTSCAPSPAASGGARGSAWMTTPRICGTHLATAGFLHLRRGLLSRRDGRRRGLPTWTGPHRPTPPGDGRSWWAKTSDGTNRLVRMEAFDAHSETVRELLDGPRLGDRGG